MTSPRMSQLSPAVRIVTRRAWLVSLIALAAETAIGIVGWPWTPLRLPIIAAAFPTLLIALTVGLLLAGERWPRLGDFTRYRPAFMVALIMGTAAGLLVLVGWAVQRAREYLGL